MKTQFKIALVILIIFLIYIYLYVRLKLPSFKLPSPPTVESFKLKNRIMGSLKSYSFGIEFYYFSFFNILV